MEFTFKIKYDDGVNTFNGLDMYHGAHSLAAISEILLLTSHAFIHEEVVIRAPAAKGFRVVLKKGNIGSYEQIIQFIVTDSETFNILNDIGTAALYDLLKYLIGGLLGVPYVIKNRKARKKLQSLVQENEELHQRLERALIQAHLPIKHQGYSVVMQLGKKPIITFDENTLEYLETEVVEPDSQVIKVAVSRFNVRTGTGRFIDDIAGISHGFSPTIELGDKRTQVLAESLAELARGNFDTVDAVVTKVNSRSGKLKRFLLHDVI